MTEVHHLLTLPPDLSLKTKANSKSLPKLLTNEILEGKVLHSTSRGEALLLIKGTRVFAKSHVPLDEGQILSLRVEESAPQPTLKLLGVRLTDPAMMNISTILSALKENLWKSALDNINRYGLSREELGLFRELMTGLSLRLFSRPSPELLNILIDGSGLNWEAKLRKALGNKTPRGPLLKKLVDNDLKGLTSKFLNQGQEKAILLRRLVSTIENIQLLNHLGLEQERKIFLPVPIQFPGGFFTVGQLLIHLPKRGRDESSKKRTDKDVFRITFLLELSDLGPLRADLSIQGKVIEVKFLLTKGETKIRIEEGMPLFLTSMREKGFSVHHVECQLEDPEIINRSLIGEIVEEEGHSISVVV